MKPLLQRALLSLLLLAALGSFALALKQALTAPQRGMDFQWSGAHLLAQHIDPWQTFLAGDPHHGLILGQQPNYLHELYVALLPLGRLPFHTALALWTAANLFFLAVALVLTSRLFKLTRTQAAILTGALLLSVPLRVSFANGQQSLFILAAAAAAYTLRSQPARGLLLGLAFAKYSFAPVLVLVDLLRRRWVTLATAALPILTGLLVAWKLTGTPLPHLLPEPLACARIAVSPGYGDLMTLLQLLLDRAGIAADLAFRLSSLAGLAAAALCAFFIARRRSTPPVELALVSLATLLTTKHLVYDFVFLLFPLAALLASPRRQRATTLGFAATAFLLLFGTLQNRLHIAIGIPFLAVNALALLCLGWSILQPAPGPAPLPAPEPEPAHAMLAA